MKIVRIAMAILALQLTLPSTAWPQSASSAPVRLVVTASRPTITVGESADVTVQLRGGQNQAARAEKDYWVYVEARDQNQTFWTRSVSVRTGSDSTRVSIPIDRAGVFMVKASHRDLREGAIWINVRRKGSPAMSRASSGPFRLLAVAWRSLTTDDAPDDVVELAIRSSDEGSKLYADGHEAAIIQAFVTAGHPASDITLKFLPSRGVLLPNPLVIHPSDGQAEGRLTSTERGSSTLAPVKIESGETVRMTDVEWQKPVQFLQPIKTARVRPEHDQRSLTDPSEDVWVELLGFDGRTVVPDEDMNVTLAVNAKGEISTSRLTLTARDPQQSVQFTPRQRGRATITATPFGAAPSDPGTIDVVVPWAALVALVLGGFAGGLGALFGKKFKGWQPLVLRGAVGVLAALVLYWVLQTGLSPVSAATVGNTLFAGLASLLAGFLGAKVLNFGWDLIAKGTPKALAHT